MFFKTVLLIAVFLSFIAFTLKAQSSNNDDSVAAKQLDEVVITATRTERKLSNVAVPLMLVSKKAIGQSGSLRLQNILSEQTGIFITNSFGNGVQMQGLSADYVLILIDGEPLVGRNGGVLDLSRITANNIRQIEIVKGPSSSLYGSEAMGGVINIITDKIKANILTANLRYGSFVTTDANLSGSYSIKKFSSSFFVNRNSSNGYDFVKDDTGKTAQPYQNYTAQLRLQQGFSSALKAGVSLRYFFERQEELYKGSGDIITGSPAIKEYNVNPYLQWRLSDKAQTALRGYLTQYEAAAKHFVKRNDSLYYNDFFQQRFARLESQTDLKVSVANDVTVGGGYTWERLNTNRYSGIRRNGIGYVYLQDEHRFKNWLTFIGGVRYDKNATYNSRISPKLAFRMQLNSKLNFTASYGAGFKAPDYRQLYLNFTNNAAGGYTVYGANEISFLQLQQQQQAGIIASITPFGNELKLLKPEFSKGINIGAQYLFSNKLSIKTNLFRNDVDNLIATQIIAYKPGNAPVFSYFNINSAITQGGETEVKYQPAKHWRIEGGYQFLQTADKAVLKQIKKGELFGRSPGSLTAQKLNRNDYGGLTDRSRHMANLKLFYEEGKWFANTRAIYRSRWGVSDVDGNLILNRDDEYADGFVQLNISGGRSFSNGFKVQAGIDNLTNYRNEIYLANQPGITAYINIAYQFSNHKQQ